ncbi:MAG: hypothetical protein JWO67_6875 [Streptosporangiaceae bacterium]|jgi:hypothetical protein|nr:hypothetical protein [Streptosporangiaceae bacterium]
MAGGSHSGRTTSWVAIGIMIAGFTVGGVGLTLGPSWPVFWAGVAVVGVGGILALATDIFSDVVLDDPRVIPEIVDYSTFGQRGERRRGGPYGETTDKPTIREPEEPFPHG